MAIALIGCKVDSWKGTSNEQGTGTETAKGITGSGDQELSATQTQHSPSDAGPKQNLDRDAAVTSFRNMMHSMDTLAEIRVVHSTTFWNELGGVSTKFTFSVKNIVKTTSTQPLLAREIIVNAGAIGDVGTSSPHEPSMTANKSYLFALRSSPNTTLSYLSRGQVSMISSDIIEYEHGALSWSTVQKLAQELGRDTSNSAREQQ